MATGSGVMVYLLPATGEVKRMSVRKLDFVPIAIPVGYTVI
jgi:hypothetical protein